MDDELLDVLDDHGRRIGVKARGAVHRDGDWHAAFHLWVVSAEGVVLQRRARTKASWPGRLDATAAGHLLAGEAVMDGLREAQEELGVAFAAESLIPLGEHKLQDPEHNGIRNRERQHVFVVRDDRPLAAWTAFDRNELDGLVLVEHDGFTALTAGSRTVPGLAFDGTRVTPVVIEAAELVPAPYLSAIADRLARAAGG